MRDQPEILETMEYGPAPESARPGARLARRGTTAGFGHFIGGALARRRQGERFDVRQPGDAASRSAASPQARRADVDAAVAGARARRCRPGRRSPGHDRARYLYAIARARPEARAASSPVLETLDNGKPIRETRDIDIPLVARHFYHHAGWAQLMESEFPGYGPVGVGGQIIPWNFPLLMLAWKIAPALALGNTVVLKPAEFTPLTALAFAEICREAGLPPGVVNIVTGDGATGAR